MFPQKSLIAALNILFTVLMVILCSLELVVLLSYENACEPEDEASLVAFSSSLTTSPPLNWSSSTRCCQWEGVQCDLTGRVITLKLVSRGLEGVINPSIGNLVSLTNLNLSNNDLIGTLSPSIGLMVSLKTMDLSANTISGPIPTNIGTLSSLKRLHLQNNNLSGPIPPTLMACTNLIDIFLGGNHLDGDISKLDFSKLLQLQKLDLLNNTLTGTLPESIYSCKSLTAIRVAANNMTGQISPKILELKSLNFLALSGNSFTNITKTLSILANSSNLTALFLGANFHGESLPSDINFVGSTGFPQLQYLTLDGCNLTASFPEWLSKIKTIRAFSLRNNKITGEIPTWMGGLPNLYFLELSSNHLYGEIPLELCRLPALLKKVDPKLNRLSLELPLLTYERSVFEQYSTFPSGLLFSNNNLSGHIPSEIGKLQGLQRMMFGNNHLSGRIPATISNLTNLEMLQLSNNKLTGKIPTSLTNLNFLSQLNLSYNNLEGPIPSGGQFSTFEEDAFEGNPRLCGKVIHRSGSNATKSKEDQSLNLKSGHYKRQMFINGLYVGFASGFSGILVIVASYVWFTFRQDRGLACAR